MVKKTTKGGESILEKIPIIKNINKKGVYIADDIEYNVRKGKKDDLIKKYEDDLNEASLNVKYAKENREREYTEEERRIQREKNTIELKKRRDKNYQNFIKNTGSFLGYLTNLFIKIGIIVGNVFWKCYVVLSDILTGLLKSFNIGQGVIIKTIILIILILLLFFTVNGFFINKKDELNDMISTDKDYSSFLIKTNTPSIFGSISTSFFNLVPEKYKYQFNFFKNKVNSFVGNDIYEITGTPRGVITSGRSDGIFHIKKENDNDNTYTTLKPKNIKLSFKENSENNDFNKLPDNVKSLYSIDKGIIIPSEVGDKNMFVYNINNSRFEDETNTIKNLHVSYKLPILAGGKENEFRFNKIKANIFSEDKKDTIDNMFIYENGGYKYPKSFVDK